MRTLRGKRALVTGAASGIGRAIALALAREGADVALVDIDRPGLLDVASRIEQLGRSALVLPCDVSQPEEIDVAVAELLVEDQRLEILVNNAGVVHYGPTHAMTADQWQRVMAINLLAPIHFIRLLLPVLRRQPDAHLVNISSIYGLVAHRKTAAYHAAKFGLVGLTESLRAEYGREGIGVTTVCPGFVNSGLFEAGTSSRKSGEMRLPSAWCCTTPEHVARKTIRGIYRNRRLVLVTPLAYGMYYLKTLAPWLLDWIQHIGTRRNTRKRLEKIERKRRETIPATSRVTSKVDRIVKGKGGHGAYPHATSDPVVIAARLTLDLPTNDSRAVKSTDPAVATVGSIHGGRKLDVSADTCQLQLTVRSYLPEIRKQLQDAIDKAKAAADSAAAPETIDAVSDQGTAALLNDEELVGWLVPVFKRALAMKKL